MASLPSEGRLPEHLRPCTSTREWPQPEKQMQT